MTGVEHHAWFMQCWGWKPGLGGCQAPHSQLFYCLCFLRLGVSKGDWPFSNYPPAPTTSPPVLHSCSAKAPLPPGSIKAWPAQLQPRMFLNSLPRNMDCSQVTVHGVLQTCIPQRPADPAPARTPSAPPFHLPPRLHRRPAPAELLSRKEGKVQRDPNAYREGGSSTQAQLLHGEPEMGGASQTTPISSPAELRPPALAQAPHNSSPDSAPSLTSLWHDPHPP